jgi:Fe2+ transport system protein FeoA
MRLTVDEIALKSLPLGSTGYISRCLSPMKADVYRLLEMGLCKGAQFTVVRKAAVFGAIEIALKGSRLCIGDELAAEFMAVLLPVNARGHLK